MDERDKWHIKNNKKGYLKIHVTVNVKTNKKILSMMQITDDEHVHDSNALPELVDDAIKSDKKITIGKLFADGAYDNNNIFRFLADNGIMPCIKVRRRMLKLDGKKEETSLGIYQCWSRKMIYKNGRTA